MVDLPQPPFGLTTRFCAFRCLDELTGACVQHLTGRQARRCDKDGAAGKRKRKSSVSGRSFLPCSHADSDARSCRNDRGPSEWRTNNAPRARRAVPGPARTARPRSVHRHRATPRSRQSGPAHSPCPQPLHAAPDLARRLPDRGHRTAPDCIARIAHCLSASHMSHAATPPPGAAGPLPIDDTGRTCGIRRHASAATTEPDCPDDPTLANAWSLSTGLPTWWWPGCRTAGLLVPEAIAYASIAALPPQHGWSPCSPA